MRHLFRTILFVSCLVAACAMGAQAAPNTTTASEAVGLTQVSAGQAAIRENLSETTPPLDPKALAARPPKIKRNDAPVEPAATPANESEKREAEEEKK